MSYTPWAIPFMGQGAVSSMLGLSKFDPTSPIIYVNESHPNANNGNIDRDGHYGSDPNFPMLTIQGAVSAVQRAGTQILVGPGNYTERILIPATYDNCKIIGLGSNPMQVQVGIQASGQTVGYNIAVLAEGWEFANMCVYSNGSHSTDYGAFLLVAGDSAVGCASGLVGETQYTYIHDCIIRGVNNPDVLIALDGAPWYVTIERCLFIQATGTTAAAIKVVSTSTSVPQKNRFLSNSFNAISDDGGHHYYGETKYSQFIGNVFGPGFGSDVKFLNVDGAGGAGAGTYNTFAFNAFCCNHGGTQEFDTTNVVATANTNVWAGNFALALGGASDTATYGVQHVEPDAAA